MGRNFYGSIGHRSGPAILAALSLSLFNLMACQQGTSQGDEKNTRQQRDSADGNASDVTFHIATSEGGEVSDLGSMGVDNPEPLLDLGPLPAEGQASDGGTESEPPRDENAGADPQPGETAEDGLDGAGNQPGEGPGDESSGGHAEGETPPTENIGGEPIPDLPGDNDPQTDTAEVGRCKNALGANPQVYHLTKSKQAVEMAVSQTLFVKVSGNQNSIQLNIPEDNVVAGLCLFLAGNQANFKLTVVGQLDRLFIIGRGNQPSGTVVVPPGSEIDNIQVDLKGNQPKVEFQGAGSYACPNSRKGQVACSS